MRTEFESLLLQKYKERNERVAKAIGVPWPLMDMAELFTDEAILESIQFAENLTPGFIEELIDEH